MPKVKCLLLILSLFMPLTQRYGQATTSSGTASKRAAALVAQMTLEEKVGQLNQLFYISQLMKPEMVEPDIREGKIGSLLFVTDPATINRFQKSRRRAVATEDPATVRLRRHPRLPHDLPVPLAMASSWDPALVEQAQTIAAREARAVGIRWTFAPMVDIARDPRWGRIVEGAGEDPYLGAKMSAAQVRGFQGTDASAPGRLLACMKHFAGYGAAMAVATTTRPISAMPSSTTSTSRRSRPPSTPASVA